MSEHFMEDAYRWIRREAGLPETEAKDMSRYPEWFVNGPLHGKDKLKEFPHLQDAPVLLRTMTPPDIRTHLTDSPLNEVSFNQFAYVPRNVDVFGQLMRVWVPETEEMSLSNRESETSRMLGELIMSPHRNGPEQFDVLTRTAGHRSEWNEGGMVAEARMREMRISYRREIDRLQTQVQNLMDASEAHRLRDNTSGVIEIVDHEKRRWIARFNDVTLFFDEGNDELPPAWVATAQGPPTAGDTHGKPYTGYGTSERAAIVALLADGLDVTVRAVETSERMR